MKNTLLFAVLSLVVACIVDADEPKLNYEQHVRPILREHCFSCHNQEKAKGGLVLDSYGATMTGGSGGEVVFGGDLESSRLWQLISHQDEPAMPPSSPQLADAKLATVRTWIEQGAIERDGAKPKKSPNAAIAFQTPVESGGPGAMPVVGCRQPVSYTKRAGAIAALTCSPNAPLIAVAGQRQVALFHTETNQLLTILPFPAGQVNSISFSRDGSLLAVGGGRAASLGLVAVYDVATGDRLMQLGDELDAVLTADIDPSLRRVALGGPSRIVKLFDTASGVLIEQMKRHTDWITAVSFSPNGKFLATADRQGGLWLWEADTGLEVQDFPGHKQAITSLSWRSDSKVLASSSEDGNIRLWKVDAGKQQLNWQAHPGGALCVRYTRDAHFVSSGRDRVAKLWNANGKKPTSFPALADIGMQTAISHDGTRVFAADWSGQIKAWNAADATELPAPAANPPTLAMRLEAAGKELQSAKTQVAKTAKELGDLLTQRDDVQSEIDAATVKIFAACQCIISQVCHGDKDDQQKQLDLKKLEEQLRDLAKQLQQAEEQVTTAESQLQQVNTAVSSAEKAVAAAEAELAAFQQRGETLAATLQATQILTQTAEEQFEQVERERRAIAQLIESAEQLADNGNPSPDQNEIAMQQTDATKSEANEPDAKSWAKSVRERAEQELAECDKRLAAAAQDRSTTAQLFARAKQQLELFKSAYK